MFDAIEKRHARLDVLVNNAGRSYEGLFALTPAEKFVEVVQANLMGTLLCSQLALRLRLRQRKGTIINISSTATRGPVGLSAYAAGKAAVNSLTASLAREVAGKGIRVNAVAPSWTETDMLVKSNQGVLAEAARRIPPGRFARAEEVASAVSALARDDMSYVVGQVLQLDGGGAR
ncbi:MAG TPA: SDR family oxidoreductase [Terriglobia bacterium]|nr:SDR family oxidoreductase [Terriglobia bacterium]